MFYESLISEIKSFTYKLMDDESRELYDARIEYYYTRDEDVLQDRIFEVTKKHQEDSLVCLELEKNYSRYPENRKRPIIVFGAGKYGRRAIRVLDLLQGKDLYVVDNDPTKQGKIVYGHEIMAPSVVVDIDGIIAVSVRQSLQAEIYHQLLDLGVSESKIIMYWNGALPLHLDFGKQYFDAPGITPSPEGEIFLDAGSYDGMTSLTAARWADGQLKKIYAFEPDVHNLAKCEENLNKTGCEYQLFNLATWDREETLRFDVLPDQNYGSHIDPSGNTYIQAKSIDSILQGEQVTFIKLDVEGSELKTLLGAAKTIKKWKPKLAVSIYHKPEDIIEIPDFLESLDMNYRYCIRQYQSIMLETVLYAV